jgi:quercetin dioxygenase-like cupin family protein
MAMRLDNQDPKASSMDEGAPTTPPRAGDVAIQRCGTQASYAGPADWFSGRVRVDPLFPIHEPARSSGGLVTFEPGARTAWHVHPLGQVLIVTAGCGRVQSFGGPVQEIRPGDVVTIPAGVKHWHGAAETTAMSHIAIQEALEGRAVEWLEQVDPD